MVDYSKKYSIEAVITAIKHAWDADTSYSPEEWSPQNPARGHCVVSVLLLQDIFGGILGKFKVEINGGTESHYFNVIDGVTLDISMSQYPEDTVYRRIPITPEDQTKLREKRLSDPDTRKRYELLKSRVFSSLEK